MVDESLDLRERMRMVIVEIGRVRVCGYKVIHIRFRAQLAGLQLVSISIMSKIESEWV